MNEKKDNSLLIGLAAIFSLAAIIYLFKKKPELKKEKSMFTGNKIEKFGDILLSVPTPNPDGTSLPLLIVWGGQAYANSKWMMDQIPQAYKSSIMVVTANHKTSLLEIEQAIFKYLKENKYHPKVIHLAGFSAGGQQVWKNMNKPGSHWKLLIDPTTYQKDISGATPETIMVYNRANWASGNYPSIYSSLPMADKAIRDKGGIVEEVKTSHANIPKYFWMKYEKTLLA